MKRLLMLVASVAVLLGFVAPPVLAADAFSGSKDAVCSGVVLEDGKTCDTIAAGAKDPTDTVKQALNLFTAIIGIIAVVMMLIGGVKYMTSQGEAAQTNNAKNTILYALIGLVVAALAQVIVRFVLAKFK